MTVHPRVMNIIKRGHSNLERLLLFNHNPQEKRAMATSLDQAQEKDPEDPAYYAFIGKKPGDKEEEKDNFEARFNFHNVSDLPPPIPGRSSNETSPSILGRSSNRFQSLRPVHSSPKTRTLGSRRHQGPEDETSFESNTTTLTDGNIGIGSVGSDYNDRLLLHDTLKQLSVEKCTKKKAHTTINKYIILTLVLTNT